MNKFSDIYLNWKVLTALILIGATVWLVAPNVVTLLLPFLLVVAFPLSILAFILLYRKNGQKNRQPTRLEGPLPEDQVASLKAQLRADQSRSNAFGQDDTPSHDQWMKL